MNRKRIWALLFLPLTIGLLAGCPWSPKTNPVIPPVDSKYLPQTSPANILINLQTAYVERNLDEYKKLFTGDYTFVFNPADAHNPDNPTPDLWGAADEFASTENMFHDDKVEGIQLDYNTSGVIVRADSLAYGRDAWKLQVTNAILQVHTRAPDGQSLTYLVPGTTEVFYFREMKDELIGDRPAWYIFRWEDQPIGGKTAEPAIASR